MMDSVVCLSVCGGTVWEIRVRLYPMGLKIEGRLCVVVGGGRVSERKVAALRECGAQVTVISPELTEKLEGLASAQEITVVRRGFAPGDLAGAVLAIAATDDRETNEAIWEEGHRERVLVNVVDVPDLCDFYVPATVTRGDLQIAIGTNGVCPALSKQMRKELSSQVGPEYEAYVALGGQLRERLIAEVSAPGLRKAALERFLASPALGFLRQGKGDAAERIMEECLQRAREEEAQP